MVKVFSKSFTVTEDLVPIMLLGLMTSVDIFISSYTCAGGFHAAKDPKFGFDCVAGFFEVLRTLREDRPVQENILCMSFAVFIVATLNCYIGLSFLGLYGVFIVQFTTLFIFWLSLVLNFKTFMITGGATHLVIFKWFTLASSLSVNFELYLDIISFSFAFLTTTIALFVNGYAFSYFRYEPNVDRLILFLNSFVISMVLLVLAGNLALLFMG